MLPVVASTQTRNSKQHLQRYRSLHLCVECRDIICLCVSVFDQAHQKRMEVYYKYAEWGGFLKREGEKQCNRMNFISDCIQP